MRHLVRAEALWVWALIFTWLLYVGVNGWYGHTTFRHLDRLPPPTVGELHRLAAAASGASRHDTLIGGQEPRPKAMFLHNVFVFRRRTLADGRPDNYLPSAATVRQMYDLLRSEIDADPSTKPAADSGSDPKPAPPPAPPPVSPPPPGGAAEPMKVPVSQPREIPVQFLESQLSLLRLQHANPPGLKDRANELAQRRQCLDAIDPLADRDPKVVDDTDRRLKNAEALLRKEQQDSAINRGVMFRDGNGPRYDQYAGYLNDLAGLVPLDVRNGNPDDRPPGNLVVAYYPPATATAGSSARRWVFLMELEYRGSWWAGWALTARFWLVAPDAPDAPVVNPRRPTTQVFSRGPGWWGFRPTAVKMSEEQLASLFVTQLDELAQGVGGLDTPPADERLRLQHFVHQLMIRRLGRPEPPASTPPSSPFARDAVGDPTAGEPRWAGMDEWVEWPRRLNGGTGWGAIQFAVVLLCVRFALDAVLIWGAVRRVERGASSPQEWATAYADLKVARGVGGDLLQTARQRIARLIRDRCHTLAAVSAILPLVGFLGTVAGLSNSLIGSTGVSSDTPSTRQAALQAMEIALGTAFDKSLLAFAGSIACTLALRWLYWRADHLK